MELPKLCKDLGILSELASVNALEKFDNIENVPSSNSKLIDHYKDHSDMFQTQSDKAPMDSAVSKESIPWSKISCDLTGPSTVLNGKVLLTIIDYASCYPEVFILERGYSNEIISCFRKTFARFGIPQFLNGTVLFSST